MIGYIIAALAGFGLSEILKEEPKKEISKKDSKYYVYVRSNGELDKITMNFLDFNSAKKMYDKIKEAKGVTIQDIADNSYNKDSDFSEYKMSDKVNPFIVAWGLGNEEFESKKWK